MKLLDKVLQKLRIKKSAKFIGANLNILDIGTHKGELANFVKNYRYFLGIDPFTKNIKKENYQLINGYFPKALEEEGEKTFDVITMLAVVEHIKLDKQDYIASECYKYMIKGGKLIITAPSPFVDYILYVLKFLKLIDGMSLEDHYKFDVNRIAGIYEKAGFKLDRREKFQFGLNNIFIFNK